MLSGKKYKSRSFHGSTIYQCLKQIPKEDYVSAFRDWVKRLPETKMTVPLDRIPDSMGYLVLTEDGAVINSGGDLENNEDLANKFLNIIHTASRIPLSASKKDKFRKISIVWDSFMYVITVSGHKIYVSKRKYVPPDPVTA